MHKNMRAKSGLAVIAVAAICGGGWWASSALASDHDEAPLVKADAAQDITDLYVFESAPGKVTIIACWAGFNDSRPQPDASGVYDGDALYTLWIDDNADGEADKKIYWRFGANAQDQIGVQFEGIPGADPKVSGPVNTVFDAGPFARVWSGHADDPFFFDAQGYLEGLDTAAVSFDSSRDFLAGLNVTAAAIEIDTDVIAPGPIQVWVTASRKG